MESQTPIVKKKETRGRKPKPQVTISTKKEEAGKGKEGKKAQLLTSRSYTQWKSLVPSLTGSPTTLLALTLSRFSGSFCCLFTIKGLILPFITDGSVPNTLVIANCEVVKPRVAAAEHISQFNEEARSPFVKKYKTIIHPGEVNRIRELPQNSKIVATHTDSPDVLIWDVESQPNRHAVLGATNSRPDLILTGHQDNAEFALAMCPTEPYVLSGGKDKSVVLWSIQDHISTTATSTGSGGSIVKQNSKPGEGNDKAADGLLLDHGVSILLDHGGMRILKMSFCPSSVQEFCSVGDDSCLILWDARLGSSPVVKVEKAHNADLHCVDWNPHDDNLILTGSADNSVRMFDRRNLTSNGVGSPIYKFEGHRAAVLCVQWSPDKSSVFGSSAEDGLLNIWDHEKVGKKVERAARTSPSPPGLFFQHAGHRDKVVDFHWNAFDPWTIVSVSDDCDTTGGGGTLQIWRMSDLIYRPEEEVLAELEKFKSHVVACASKPRES
ncbi:WD-40 repeat-containing protein MSI4 [Morella rubra]|uniref:WD-40 repeat-containing protein MSI4 n=1 Tax=Morella rubra TaxID=262757 RepID=A0A6A1UQG0_9ROSI|nr:WD-40 repeat-containing protein MSI4 [Morella rubra]